MKTKINLTIFAILMSIQFGFAQAVTINDQIETSNICSTISPEQGWGTMVSNDNGAYTNEEKIYKDGVTILSIAFTDAKNGCAVGVSENQSVKCGVFYHTQDGGNTWSLSFKSGTSMKIYSIGFKDANNGWAITRRTVGGLSFETVLLTSDGGETWMEQSLAVADISDIY